ncbi:flagellar hook-associated protein FlgK [Aureimonas sp. AU40]|uniref:flagellar hook-associated protein FlgK n=1 Tax=Aureimonas sp. AU40 TaxID=1637747 RepID=UPI00078256D5|nr:flagellar hook-associated protein FlgK [Aureimonas sp. AU40]
MTLSSAINTATSSLQAAQTQTALVSRNIANANVAGATRKYANVVTGADGRLEVRSVAQSGDTALFRNVLNGTSDVAKSGVVAGGLDRLNEVIGDTDTNGSPAALVSALSDALTAYRTSPANYEVGKAAVTAAQKVVSTLNAVSSSVDDIRQDADGELKLAASDMTQILKQIQELNQRITAGTSAKRDVTDEIDKRDQQIQKLSEYVGINVQTRGDNDVVIYTDSGVTMFDRTARSIDFTPTPSLKPGQSGGAFRIDGTVVTGDNAFMPITSGKIAGLVELRDKIAPQFQTQLDAIANNLIDAFSETDGTTTKQGLFQDASATVTGTGAGTAASPRSASSTLAGAAGRIQIATSALGDPTLIRDGGINGATFKTNTDTSATGFTARIATLISNLGSTRGYSAAGADPTGKLVNFAASSMSWLQGTRASVLSTNEYQQTLLDKTKTTLSNETGIDLNTELTRLLDLQRSFQASSKIITTVDQMMAALLQAI